MPPADALLALLLAKACGLFLTAAVSDLASYRIPNWISLALAALCVPAALAAGGVALLAAHAALGAAVLVAGMGLFAARIVGGGDAKLLAAAALWAGPSAFAPMLVYVTLAGGALALLLIAFRAAPLPAPVRGLPWVAALYAKGAGVPYGVAIAAGAIAAAPHTEFLSAIV